MRITYRNKLLDIIAFNIYHQLHSPILLGVLGLCLVVIARSIWSIVSEAQSEYSVLVQIITFTILQGVCVAAGVVGILLYLILANMSRMNKGLLSECTITLGPEFITTESQLSRSELKWNAIQKIRRTSSHLFLYISQHGAIVIPKRVFNSDAASEEFWLLCQEQTRRISGAM